MQVAGANKMARFEIIDLPLKGLKLVKRKPLIDARGFLSRLFCGKEFEQAGINLPIKQINHTRTAKQGTVRGMHFQRSPFAEAKFVSCLVGSVFDVAVDLRVGSPTYLQWHGEVLSSENQYSLHIPEGFAHGFQTLTEDCELLYLHSASYHPSAEGALNALDPCLSIAWPLAITELSDRDKKHPFVNHLLCGVSL
jgi:dTDP-4-dehydrorhamnose 3,5-epimerase